MILKHGKKYYSSIDNNIYKMKCKSCGCIFTYSRETDKKCVNHLGHIRHAVLCPECTNYCVIIPKHRKIYKNEK